jgi:hypothetical protein
MFEQDLVAPRRLVDHELQIVGEEVAIFHEPLLNCDKRRALVGQQGQGDEQLLFPADLGSESTN